jgi:imidazole glycerol-phosphate synthase subunit HisF
VSFHVYPAIDLRHGRVVRLTRGDDDRRTAYSDESAEVLAGFARSGARRVHAVDLDAAFGEPPQRELIAELATAARTAGVELQLGGGLRDEEAVAWALEVGCARAVVGSMTAREPERFGELAKRYPNRVVPALDVEDDVVRIAGWTEGAGRSLPELCATLRGLPCPAVLVTDVSRDGTLEGPNLELARRVAEASGIPALLSGGVSSLDDLRRAAATRSLAGAVVGRALYEGRFTVEEALAACVTTHLAVRVIPCLDVAGGRVVKGVKFQDLRDLGDPAEAAERYAAEGADEIVFLDVGAAPEERGTALDWVRRAAERVFVPLTVGGGVRSVDDARALLAAGADKVGVNTAAAARPELLTDLARRFGSQCVVLSIDARRSEDGSGWEAVTHGGRTGTGRDAVAWAVEGVERGAGEILLTSIDADGTRGGYDLELLAAVSRAVPVPVIASGGAGEPSHLADALGAGASAVLAASIFHERRCTVGQVKDEIDRRGFRVRPVLEVER